MKKLLPLLLLVLQIHSAYATGYCTPSYSAFSNKINNVTLTGNSGTLINDNGAASPVGYEDRTAAVSTIILQQGANFSGSLTYSSNFYLYGQIYIDFNDNGTFESSEAVTGVIGSCGAYTSGFTVAIPVSAATGTHRMRVRCGYVGGCSAPGSIDPCANYLFGNTMDYNVTIQASLCNGGATAGIITSNVTSVCFSTTVFMNLYGYSTDPTMTYQWSSSPDSSTWTDISAATTTAYNVSGLLSPVYYRCLASCPAGNSAYSQAVKIAINPYTTCYCSPSYSNFSDRITNISITGNSGTLINDNGSASPAGYEDRTSAVPTMTLQQGAAYTGSVTYSSNFYLYSQAYIDFNDNGTFESSEAVTGVIGACGSYTIGFTLNISASRTIGTHRMRVRSGYVGGCSAPGSIDPCGNYLFGNTKDYLVNIQPSLCNSGTIAGTINPNVTNACFSTNVNLSLYGCTTGAGMTYQWSSSPDSTTWTDIPTATTTSYSVNGLLSSIYYRCYATCGGGNSAYSYNGVKITANPYTSCYCVPSYQLSPATNYSMNNFSLLGNNGTQINDNGPAVAATNGYEDRTAVIPTITLQQGANYSGVVAENYNFYIGNEIWIDFNDNGYFDAGEVVSGPFGYNGSPSYTWGFTLSIPAAAALGTHRMRVRSCFDNGGLPGGFDPCGNGNAYYGKARDYLVNIQPSLCNGGNIPGTVFTNLNTACFSSTVTESLYGYTTGAGMTYQWSSSPDSSTWTNIGGATTPTYSTTGLISKTYYRCYVACGGGNNGYSNVTRVDPNAIALCYCTPVYGIGYNAPTYAMTNFALTGAYSTFINDSGPATPTTNGYEDQTVIVPTITLAQGGAYSGVVTENFNFYMGNQIWIDFNDNGYFDATEKVTGTFGWTSGSVYAFGFTLNIPLTATLGSHRMRVRSCMDNSSLPGSFDPCSSTAALYGMARDYTVNIIPACTGTPVAGVVTPTISTGCAAFSSTLSLTGTTVAGNITYQWQTSADSTTWTDIGGATNISYNAMVSASIYYRCNVTCGISHVTSATPGVRLILSSPTATISSSTILCAGLSKNITFTGEANDTVTYNINGGANQQILLNGSGSATLSVSPATTTSYNILSASSMYGCITSLTGISTITVSPIDTFTGATNSDWNTPGNWQCGGVPIASLPTVIPASLINMPVVPSGAFAVNTLFIAAGDVLTINSGGVLNVNGNISNAGTTGGAGSIILSGSTVQVIDGKGIYGNMGINNNAGVSVYATDTTFIAGTLSMMAGTFTTGGRLTIVSTVSGTGNIGQITGGNISGNVNIHQYIQPNHRAYRFWGHPFTTSIALSMIEQWIDLTGAGGVTNGFTTTITNNPSVFWYNTTTGNSTKSPDPGWAPFLKTDGSGNNAFKQYEGINLFIRGAKGLGLDGLDYTPQAVNITMYGPVNQGTQKIPLVKGTNSDYNQIGNPFPSPVDIGTAINNAKTAGKIAGAAFFLWDPSRATQGAFMAIPISATPYKIEANTSFQVEAAANNDTLAIMESNKANTFDTILLRTANEYVSLDMYDGNYILWDNVRVRFDETTTAAKDDNDGGKPTNPDLNFYSLSPAGEKMSIDARPYAEGKVIPLGLKTSHHQQFIIKADDIAVPTGGKVYLHDKYLKQYTQLSQGTEYTFTTTPDTLSQGENRFELGMGEIPADEVIGSTGLSLQITPNPTQANIVITYATNSMDNKTLSIINATGENVTNMQLGQNKTGSVNISLSKLPAGIYIAELTCGNKKVTQRIVKD